MAQTLPQTPAAQVLNLGGGAPGIDFSSPAAAAQSQFAASEAARKKIDDLRTQEQTEIKPVNDQIVASQTDLQKTLAGGAKREPLPEAPKFNPTEVQNTMGGLMALAAFSGLASRQPLTMSLNALAGMVEGVNRGDQVRFERSYKDFDTNLRKVIETNRQYQHEFENVLKSKELSISQQMEQIRLINKKYEHLVGDAAAQNTDIKGAVDTFYKAKGLTDRAEQAHQRITAMYAAINQRAAAATARLEADKARFDAGKKALDAAAADRMKQLAELDKKADKLSADQLKQAKINIEANYRARVQAVQAAHGIAAQGAEAQPSVPDTSDLPPGFTIDQIEPPGG